MYKGKTNAKLEELRKHREEMMAKLSPQEKVELLSGLFEWATGRRPSKAQILDWEKNKT